MNDLKKIGEKIAERRKDLDLTLEEVGERVGVAKSTIQRYEAGKIASPKQAVLESIARALSMDIMELTGKRSVPSNAIGVKSVGGAKVAVPILGRVAAGEGAFADSNITGYIMEDADRLSGGEEYAYLRVEGDSMYPEFKDGDMVLVKCCSCIDSGSYGVVMIDGDNGVIKRVECAPDHITLHSVNPMYPPRVFKGSDMLRIRIFGEVKGLRRSF